MCHYMFLSMSACSVVTPRHMQLFRLVRPTGGGPLQRTGSKPREGGGLATGSKSTTVPTDWVECVCMVQDHLGKCGSENSHGTARFWWHRFGKMFAAEVLCKWVEPMPSLPYSWRRLDEVLTHVNGSIHHRWSAVDVPGGRLEACVFKNLNRKTAMRFAAKSRKWHGRPHVFVTMMLFCKGRRKWTSGRPVIAKWVVG